MAGDGLGWVRWRQICGWLALTAATLWALKFTFIVATPDYAPGEPIPKVVSLLGDWYVGLVGPTLGSVLGLVAVSGLAEPLVRRRRWFVGLPVAVAVALVGTMAITGLTNTLATWSIESANLPADSEPAVLFGAVALMLVSAVLLHPTPSGSALGAVLGLGGILWITQAILVALGATVEGWLVVVYQAGLYLLAVGATWLVAAALRAGSYRAVALGALAIIAASAVGSLPLLSGGLGLLMVGSLGVVEGVRRMTRGAPVHLASPA